MTNAEKYLKDGITGDEIFNLAQELGEYLTINCKANYVFTSDINLFFQQPKTPILTEDERIILRNINKNYKYISRSCDTELYLKNEVDDNCRYIFRGFSHLFQFIKERRRI